MSTWAFIFVSLVTVLLMPAVSAAVVVMDSPRQYMVTTEGGGAGWTQPQSSDMPFWGVLEYGGALEGAPAEETEPDRKSFRLPIPGWVVMTACAGLAALLALKVRCRSKSIAEQGAGQEPPPRSG